MRMETLLHSLVLTSCLVIQTYGEINLGSYGTASHFPPYKANQFLPARALDPPKSSYFSASGAGTCSHSGDWPNITFAYWRIEFPEEVYITNIELYYRSGFAYRLDGITLSITNDPDNLAPDDICFKDVTDGTANIHQIFPCNKIGKFLMFSKHRSDNGVGTLLIELCYVEILGCRVGYFGSNCSKSCPTNCIGLCEPKNGECVSGCITGWQGSQCEQACVGGYFGINCDSICSENCLYPPCNHVTGQCGGGCAAGWTSDNCTKTCDSGRFGAGCSKTCDGCVLNDCHHSTGECTDTTRCKPGYYYSKKCDKVCLAGYFGDNCTQLCPENCYRVCEPKYGECVSGCIEGWRGPTCEQGIACSSLPTIDNAIDFDRSVVYRYPDTVEVQCERGYIRIGPSTINCMTKGQWNVTLYCTAVQCEIGFDENRFVHPNNSEYHYGDQIRIGCKFPFVLSSSGDDIMCDVGGKDTGKWSKALPACTDVQSIDQTAVVGLAAGLSIVICILIGVIVLFLWTMRRPKEDKGEKRKTFTTSHVKDYDDLNVEMREQQNVYSEIDNAGVHSS